MRLREQQQSRGLDAWAIVKDMDKCRCYGGEESVSRLGTFEAIF